MSGRTDCVSLCSGYTRPSETRDAKSMRLDQDVASTERVEIGVRFVGTVFS